MRNDAVHGARSRRPDAAEAGFTLIELVVVVAILGVLAAIAVPAYLGMQNGARDAAVQADLVNARAALAAFAADHDGGRPSSVTPGGAATWAASTVDLTTYGWSFGPSTKTIDYAAASGSSWCLLATSTTGSVFRATASSGIVRSASCP